MVDLLDSTQRDIDFLPDDKVCPSSSSQVVDESVKDLETEFIMSHDCFQH